MKRVITIIAILAIVFGAAFATDSTTKVIRLGSIVGNIKPIFQIQISGVSEIRDGQATPINSSNLDVDSDDAVTVFSINKGGKVYFQALLTNRTNSKEIYSLSFSGGEFTDVVRRGVTGSRAPSSITTSLGMTVDGDKIGKGIASVAYGTSSDSNKPVVVTFDGALDTNVYNVEDGVVLATAEFDYPADPTIDAGTYYADITLTVSAEL